MLMRWRARRPVTGSWIPSRRSKVRSAKVLRPREVTGSTCSSTRLPARTPAYGTSDTDLKEFADLRNAIVHERRGGHSIAEPHEKTVRRLEEIPTRPAAG